MGNLNITKVSDFAKLINMSFWAGILRSANVSFFPDLLDALAKLNFTSNYMNLLNLSFW